MQIELDNIYNMDCLEGMKQMEAESVDLTVTSPPYDNLRSYGGIGDDWNFYKFKAIATELVRITKPGGVIVWVVADATIDGSETGTSFKQALHFKELGMNLHDTMIWEKKSYVPLSHNRYEQCFEFMFVLSKGTPKTFNPLKSKCETAGVPHRRTKSNKEEGSAFRNRDAYTVCNEYKIRKNIFEYDHPNVHFDHPAIFPAVCIRRPYNLPKGDYWKSDTFEITVRTYLWNGEYRIDWNRRCAETAIVKTEKMTIPDNGTM